MNEMDDKTLRLELESRGHSIGPIVDSTRELYQKLLKRLIEEEINAFNDCEHKQRLTDTSDQQKVNIDVKQNPKYNSFLLFIVSLILCIIFAYFLKH